MSGFKGMSGVEVSICPPRLQHNALELVLTGVPPDQQRLLIEGLRPLALQGVDAFSALVIARHEGTLVGAAWLQPQVGRSGTLWPPQLVDLREAGPLKRDLARNALEVGICLPVDVVQVLLESQDDPFARDLLAIGFTQLAELVYLALVVKPGEKLPPADGRLHLASPATANPALLRELLADSYDGTLDCPQLEGIRDLDDTLAGYQAVGDYDESLWFIAHWDQQPAGVLILAPYEDSPQWELVYMGITPSLRGQGIGRQMLTEVHRLAARGGIEQVVLAVDADNSPARKMYDTAGYTEWSRRTAYINALRENCAD